MVEKENYSKSSSIYTSITFNDSSIELIDSENKRSTKAISYKFWASKFSIEDKDFNLEDDYTYDFDYKVLNEEFAKILGNSKDKTFRITFAIDNNNEYIESINLKNALFNIFDNSTSSNNTYSRSVLSDLINNYVDSILLRLSLNSNTNTEFNRKIKDYRKYTHFVETEQTKFYKNAIFQNCNIFRFLNYVQKEIIENNAEFAFNEKEIYLFVEYNITCEKLSYLTNCCDKCNQNNLSCKECQEKKDKNKMNGNIFEFETKEEEKSKYINLQPRPNLFLYIMRDKMELRNFKEIDTIYFAKEETTIPSSLSLSIKKNSSDVIEAEMKLEEKNEIVIKKYEYLFVECKLCLSNCEDRHLLPFKSNLEFFDSEYYIENKIIYLLKYNSNILKSDEIIKLQKLIDKTFKNENVQNKIFINYAGKLESIVFNEFCTSTYKNNELQRINKELQNKIEQEKQERKQEKEEKEEIQRKYEEQKRVNEEQKRENEEQKRENERLLKMINDLNNN